VLLRVVLGISAGVTTQSAIETYLRLIHNIYCG
jgi:hypothetical protein